MDIAAIMESPVGWICQSDCFGVIDLDCDWLSVGDRIGVRVRFQHVVPAFVFPASRLPNFRRGVRRDYNWDPEVNDGDACMESEWPILRNLQL